MYLYKRSVLFQSTLPRGERPYFCEVSRGNVRVSIHAPAWGATLHVLYSNFVSMFQSTLPRGERLSRLSPPPTVGLFQSTLPRGERRGDDCGRRHAEVSIHAPAWGATKRIRWRRNMFWFQSTLPRGERPFQILGSQRGFLFQSTLPRGERHRYTGRGLPAYCFNPRSRVGSDSEKPLRLHGPAGFNPRSRVGSDAPTATLRPF